MQPTIKTVKRLGYQTAIRAWRQCQQTSNAEIVAATGLSDRAVVAAMSGGSIGADTAEALSAHTGLDAELISAGALSKEWTFKIYALDRRVVVGGPEQ